MANQTVGEVRALIRKAKAIYIQPRLGISERWLKISKPEAEDLLHPYAHNETMRDVFELINELKLEDDGTLYLS